MMASLGKRKCKRSWVVAAARRWFGGGVIIALEMPMSRFRQIFAIVVALSTATLPGPKNAKACTSFLVSKGASVDGSTMITYAADSHDLYGELTFTPAAKHKNGAKRTIRDWDSNKVLGQIDEVPETYRVLGNMNEHQLVIGETTFGGRKELEDPKGKIDYGSLIMIALERAKTAREAIRVMTDLANEHGYASSGESFSIADPNEVWIMDLIGKGPDQKGVVWVACKVPEGYVTAHANQPRIRTFPQNDPEQCVYAKDVVSFARSKGYYEGPDDRFSFVDAYATQTCRDLRVREARVWAFYNQVAPSLKLSPDYAACKPGAEPYPLWIKPDRKLSVRDLILGMRNHFENTVFDMRKDVGAGPHGLPYRWRPLTWKHEGKTYVHERATATQQTGFSFVSQSRAWLPHEIGGVLWFSVDDAASTVYVPMYAGIREVPKPYAVGTGDFQRFSWDSAFWVFNGVSNFTYLRYEDMIKDVEKAQQQLENGFFDEQATFEKAVLDKHGKSKDSAVKELTRYSREASDKVLARWKDLGPELLVKYMDGNVRDDQGKVTHPSYPKEHYARIVAETGDHFYLRDESQESAAPSASTLGPASASVAAPPSSGISPPISSAPSPTKAKGGCAVGVSSASGEYAGLLMLLFGWMMKKRRGE